MRLEPEKYPCLVHAHCPRCLARGGLQRALSPTFPTGELVFFIPWRVVAEESGAAHLDLRGPPDRSALLSIPIPIIYISEEPDNKEYVIDGQQRLTSFFSFLDGKFPDGKDFRLTGLNVFKELNGKRYDSLPEKLQDTIQYFKLRTVAFKRDSDPDLKCEIFERLNTGSVQLNIQKVGRGSNSPPFLRIKIRSEASVCLPKEP